MIAILRRAGLRISEALALAESDLDPKSESVLVRAGEGGKRRVVGMDDWGWEHVSRWAEHRIQLPIGPLVCVLAGPTRGRGVGDSCPFAGSWPGPVCGGGSRRELRHA